MLLLLAQVSRLPRPGEETWRRQYEYKRSWRQLNWTFRVRLLPFLDITDAKPAGTMTSQGDANGSLYTTVVPFAAFSSNKKGAQTVRHAFCYIGILAEKLSGC